VREYEGRRRGSPKLIGDWEIKELFSGSVWVGICVILKGGFLGKKLWVRKLLGNDAQGRRVRKSRAHPVGRRFINTARIHHSVMS